MSRLENIREFLKKGRTHKFSLNNPHITSKKRNHLQRMLNAGGMKEKFLFLPIDHGIEHGPGDFLDSPWASNPEYQLELAKEGRYSGIAIHIGFAQKHWQKKQYRKTVPLILKINGKTNIPSDEEAISPLTGTVEDALKLGADAIGYTLYVGSPRQYEDVLQFLEIRLKAEIAGLPIIMWAYPRGKFADEKGGKDTMAFVAYAARLANELGADICKINAPKPVEAGKYDEEGQFKKYNELLELSLEEQLAWAVINAGSTGVLISGGSKLGDEDMLDKVELAVKAGVNGVIFGRNMWQRSFEEALEITKKVKDVLVKNH